MKRCYCGKIIGEDDVPSKKYCSFRCRDKYYSLTKVIELNKLSSKDLELRRKALDWKQQSQNI